MKITLPVNGTVQTIPVPIRVWVAFQLSKLIDWLVAPEYTADFHLVEKPKTE